MAFPESHSRIRVIMQVIYLGGDPRKHGTGNGSDTGKGRMPKVGTEEHPRAT